jgi:hypothetical protein
VRADRDQASPMAGPVCALMDFSISRRLLRVRAHGKNFAVRATSGNGAEMNDANATSHRDHGPIPTGLYTILPRELSNPSLLVDLGRTLLRGDWGDWRIVLHPAKDTQVFGRSGFFLHGGSWDGSAGCIDIGGGVLGSDATDRVLKVIESCQAGVIAMTVGR